MSPSRDVAALFANGLQRARVCKVLLALAGSREQWTPHGPPLAARIVPPRDADPDARRMLAACWALWNGSSTLSLDELLFSSPRHLEAMGELLAAIARGPAAIDDWLARFEPRIAGRPGPGAVRGRRTLSG